MKFNVRTIPAMLRTFYQRVKKLRGETIVKRMLPESDLYLYSKRAHVRSNEREIIRIAEYVSSCEGNLVMLDVGANIGVVTLLTYNNLQKGRYLCIDGNDEFFPLLQKNMAQIPGAACVKAYLSDQPEVKHIDTKTYVNTASILENPSGQRTDFQTLDAICQANDIQPNFIKIDTDGFDSKILRGFSKHLSSNENAVIYFEYAPMHQVFNHIEKNPADIFDYLYSFGFEEFYFYDDQGSYFCKVLYTEKDRIDEITTYCLTGCKLFNVLIFHRSNVRFKEIFTIGEKNQLQVSMEKWEAWWAIH